VTSAARFPAETSLGPPLQRGCGKLIPAYNRSCRTLFEDIEDVSALKFILGRLRFTDPLFR